MIKLFKHMKKREVLMIVTAVILICGQVYFDLKIPEFIDQLTVLATSGGDDISQSFVIGGQMLLCLILSLTLSIVCGYLTAKAAAGFTFTLRNIEFNQVMDFSEAEVLNFGVPSLITRATNDISQIQILISMGLQIAVKSPIMAV